MEAFMEVFLGIAPIIAAHGLGALELLFLYQVQLSRIAFEDFSNASDAADDAVRDLEFLQSLVEDVKLHLKVTGVLLPLAFTAMQISSNGWALLRVALLASIVVLSFSAVINALALRIYISICRCRGGPVEFCSHARQSLTRPFAVDPWILMSLPSVWTYWSFVLLFSSILLSAWDQTSIPTTESKTLPHTPLARTIIIAFIVALGMGSVLLMVVIWRRYLHHRTRRSDTV